MYWRPGVFNCKQDGGCGRLMSHKSSEFLFLPLNALSSFSCCQNLSAPLDIRIKWPNDIYTSKGLKIGGVLIHTTWSKDRFNVVTGVGLNVSNRQPTTCTDQMLLEACGTSSSSGSESAFPNDPPDVPRGIPREVLLASIVTQLEACFQVVIMLPAYICIE